MSRSSWQRRTRCSRIHSAGLVPSESWKRRESVRTLTCAAAASWAGPISSWRCSSRGEHPVVTGPQHVSVDPSQRVPVGQLLGVHPVGGGVPAVQEPRVAERERPRAQPDDASPSSVGRIQRLHQARRNRRVPARQRRHDDGVGGGEVAPPVVHPQHAQAEIDRRLVRAEAYVVRRLDQARTRRTEHLARHRDLEQRHAGQHGDPDRGTPTTARAQPESCPACPHRTNGDPGLRPRVSPPGRFWVVRRRTRCLRGRRGRPMSPGPFGPHRPAGHRGRSVFRSPSRDRRLSWSGPGARGS